MAINVTVTRRFRGAKDKTASSPSYMFQNPQALSGGVTMEQVNAAILNKKSLHGFERSSNNVLSFNAGTGVFSITGTQFGIWYMGYQYLKDTETVTLTLESGIPSRWFVFWDNELTLSVNETCDVYESLLVAILIWNGTTGEIVDRRHPAYTDWDDMEAQKVPIIIPFTAVVNPILPIDYPTHTYQDLFVTKYGEYPNLQLIIEVDANTEYINTVQPIRHLSDGKLDYIDWYLDGAEVTGKIKLSR